MTFTLRSIRAPLAMRSAFRQQASVARVQRMGFAGAQARWAGKESALNQDGRAEEAERHKQDQLKDVEQGKQEWKAELASDGEEAVKADRGETPHMDHDDIAKLQEQTKGHAEKKHN